jgi:hypothetical protein
MPVNAMCFAVMLEWNAFSGAQYYMLAARQRFEVLRVATSSIFTAVMKVRVLGEFTVKKLVAHTMH